MVDWFNNQGRRGDLSRAAESLHCQVSFLSRVMNSEIHLTPDHAFSLVRFWKLDDEEAKLFRLLVDWERASDPEYRSYLSAQIAASKKNHESLHRRVEKETFPVDHQEALYFSSWHWSAIHFLVAVPKYHSARSISERLHLPEALVSHCLDQLERSGLVAKRRGRWEYASGQFHLPKHSPFVASYHHNWRGRAVLDAQDPGNEGIHYTSVLTLSEEDLSRLKEMMLQFISESNQLARPSAPEECVAITCDLFKV